MDKEIAKKIYDTAEKEIKEKGRTSIDTYNVVEKELNKIGENVLKFFFMEGSDNMIFNSLRWKHFFLDENVNLEKYKSPKDRDSIHNSNRLEVDYPSLNKSEIKNKNRHKNAKSYPVTDITTLYAIADAGLIEHYLHGVIVKDGVKTFHFDRVPEIKAIIDACNKK
jgi:hypothetical protein